MKLVAKTLYGLEEVLVRELEGLGVSKINRVNRAVEFEGDIEMIYRTNFSLRTALSILKPVAQFNIGSSKDLYNRSKKIKWDDIMDVSQTFSIIPVVHSNIFNHTGYAGLVLKDAIADYFRFKYNSRPSVDTVNPDIVFNLRVSESSVTVSVDSSVVPLFKRGYRRESAKAPINEVLAAGIILLSGWDGGNTIFDPMCGSGTIPIEAALIAKNIPPGKYRNFFGFMNWRDFDNELFSRVKMTELSKKGYLAPYIRCSDRSHEAIRNARLNIRNAGFAGTIHTDVDDFFKSESSGKEFTIIMNPPYGERLKENDMASFYSNIGERLKHGYSGSTAWIISSNLEAIKSIGLKPSRKYILFNGALESRLLRFDLYSGSRKSKP